MCFLLFFLPAYSLLQALIRRFACDAFINADKVRNAVISTTGRCLADRYAAAAEQLFCLIDAHTVEILLKGHARYAAKAARKITVAHSKTARQFTLIHILGVVIAHKDHRIINEGCRLVVRRFFVSRGVTAQDLDQKLHDFELCCHARGVLFPLVLPNQGLQGREERRALQLLFCPDALAPLAVDGKAHHVLRALLLGGELQEERGGDLNNVIFIPGQIFCENVVDGIGAKKHQIPLADFVFHTVQKQGIGAAFDV